MTLVRLAGRARTVARAWLLFVSLLLVGACTLAPGPAPEPLRPVRFMAGYKPQANLPFVAAYLAEANGYFREQGLEVEIQHSAGQGEHLKLLLQGTVDVTTAEGDAVLARRAEGIPVVAFALFGPKPSAATRQKVRPFTTASVMTGWWSFSCGNLAVRTVQPRSASILLS